MKKENKNIRISLKGIQDRMERQEKINKIM